MLISGAGFILAQVLLVSIAVPTARASSEDDLAAAEKRPLPADSEVELLSKSMGPSTSSKRFLAGLLRPGDIHDGKRKISPIAGAGVAWSDDANDRDRQMIHEGMRRKRTRETSAMPAKGRSTSYLAQQDMSSNDLTKPDTLDEDSERYRRVDGKRNYRRGGIYDQLLRPNNIHTGKRKRFLDSLAMARPIHSGKRSYGGIYDQLLRPDIIHAGKRSYGGIYDQLLRPDIIHTGRRKRFLDSLAMARPIHSGKRFIDSVAGSGPIHHGRRKRLLDTLVRARPIYDGKRSA